MEKAVLIQILPSEIKMTTIKLVGGAYHKEVDELTQSVRFDDDLFENNEISLTKINDAIKALKLYKTVCQTNNIYKIFCYASSFFEMVPNKKPLFDEIIKETGFNFTILTAEEEIKLLYSTLLNSVEYTKATAVYINPHNIYIINFLKRNLISYYFLPFGSHSLANDFQKETNSNVEDVVSKIKDFVKSKISELNMDLSMFEEPKFIGGGNIFITASKFIRKLTHYPLDMDNNFICKMPEFDKAFKMIKEYGFDKTKRLAGISNDHLDTIISGFAIIEAFKEIYNIDNFCIAERTTKNALISNKIARESCCEGIPNDVVELGLENIRYYYEIEDSNADFVYGLCIELFKQMAIIHKLTRKHIKALKIAAFLYDCGKRINFKNHSRYSNSVIINSNLHGVSHKDLIIAAFACQFQNIENFSLSEWVKYRAIVDEDDLIIARKIGTLINLASSLDSTKLHKITELNCDLLGDIVIIKAKATEEISYEIMIANKSLPIFKKVFGKSFQII